MDTKQSKIDGLIKLYYDTEIKIIKILDEMENEECTCDECETISFIHEGEWEEIITRCINCGGMVDKGR